MARVVPVGPIDPELYAFAKKEAEKAERNPRYVPKKRETPAHTVLYRRVGATVKAFVIDKIAPITFSSPGSAIPIAPSFLHESHDSSSGVGNTASYLLDMTRAAFIGSYRSWEFLYLVPREVDVLLSRIAYFGTGISPKLYTAAKNLWGGEGEFPNVSHPALESIFTNDGAQIESNHAEIRTNNRLEYSHSSLNATIEINRTFYESEQAVIPVAVHDVTDMDYDVSGTFLHADIRDVKFDEPLPTGYKKARGASVKRANTQTTMPPTGQELDDTLSITFSGAVIDPKRAFVAFDGSTIFPVLDVDIASTENVYAHYRQTADSTFRRNLHYRVKTNKGVCRNLESDRVTSLSVTDTDVNYNHTDEGPVYSDLQIGLFEDRRTDVAQHIFVMASVGGFDGVLIWTRVYESWYITGNRFPFYTRAIEKTKYSADSALRKHRLARYFNVIDGEYSSDDAVQVSPPSIIADGICLQHAWFFCDSNEALNGVYDTNNHNHISAVVYPQGKHQFAVDEAEIFSVKLNRTPSFVARPGDTIELAMYAVNNGSPLVPYVVRGLVKELDEDGNPTDFYLAADGEISGTFEQSEEGHGTAKFKLSPHQKLDAYRLISVETTTTRQHGVQAHIEVLGPGVRVPPGPPSITIETLHPTVLAGQESAFHITATHMANGSRIKYEIRSAGSVVSSSSVYIAYGAGVIRYLAPFVTRETDGHRFVLVDSPQESPPHQPSSRDFEIELIHENAPEPVAFSVKYAHESYTESSDRPEPLPSPELFYLGAKVAHASSGNVSWSVNEQQSLVHRVWCSIKTKRVYVTYWDGKSCEVSNILKKNPESGKYEFNPDWKEVPFDYPPAVDPYEIKGTLEPYVYAYMDYEASLTGE